jgi:hypothetical protein
MKTKSALNQTFFISFFAACLILTSGCGPTKSGVSTLEDLTSTSPEPSPAPAPTPEPLPSPEPISFTETFSDNLHDPTLWSVCSALSSLGCDGAVAVNEINQQLEITPLASTSGSHFNGYLTVNHYDLTGGEFAAEAVQLPSQIPGITETQMTVFVDSANNFSITVDSGSIKFSTTVAARRTSTSMAYNGSAHRWWKIRHDSKNDTVRFDTSADGVTWINRYSVVRSFSVKAVGLQLDAGTNGPFSAPGKAIFDNVSFQ